MADEYSKYKLFRKYKTEDGVNYTPLDEYQALYESGDGVDCSCGYRKYKWESGNDTKITILNSDTDRTIPMQTFRIDATYPNNSGNYFIRFTTTPDTDTTSNKGFSICPDEGTIWDNGTKQYITAQTNIYDNVYEYTFSVPVYFSNGEENAPYEQVTAVTYNCEYICGNILNESAASLTINNVQGDWIREGNTFTSNDINDNEITIERIYFSVSEPTNIKFTIDQDSEKKYDYLVISNLDKAVVSGSPSTTGSSYNYYHHSGKTTGSTSMVIKDTEEHFVELMYKKDGSGESGRDNVIVTLGIKLYDVTSEYEVWREYDYCPNDDTIETLPTGNVDYRNPKKSCKCGYREYDWEWDETWEDAYICGKDIGLLDSIYEYEVWKEYEYCPTSDGYKQYTGNVDYRNPQKSCKCGYREYEYVWDETWEDAYICGNILIENAPSLTINSVQGDWIREGNTFTSDKIGSNGITVERIYFSVSEPANIKFTIDQSSDAWYDYLTISNLDKAVVRGHPESTGSSYNYYNHKTKTTGTTSMPISDTNEHFIELAYHKDYSTVSGRDNVIVKLSVNNSYDILSIYEVWKEKSYCPDTDEYDSYTGNVDYRNPTTSCKCGYREYKWLFSGEEYVCGSDIGLATTLIRISSDTDRTIPMQTFRIDTTELQNDDNYYIWFATTPNTDTFIKEHNFSICPDVGYIYDNGTVKYITEQTKIDDNIYEYTFSVPVYFSRVGHNPPVSQVSAVINNELKPYYKYEVWREYEYCPNDDTIEILPTGNLKYLNPILVGRNWVMTTQTKLGSELGEGYEQDKRYVLYESYSLCNGELIETEWRESNLVFKTEIEEKYIKYEANETFILMGSTVGDIIAHIPSSRYCCESTITGCKQYCYNLYSISTIDKDGNRTQIYSGRMNGTQVTLRDNENYSYSLSFGDYCGNSGRDAYFTYTLKDEDYHYYMCAVKYQKYDYEDDTKWVEIGYTPRYPSNK